MKSETKPPYEVGDILDYIISGKSLQLHGNRRQIIKVEDNIITTIIMDSSVACNIFIIEHHNLKDSWNLSHYKLIKKKYIRRLLKSTAFKGD